MRSVTYERSWLDYQADRIEEMLTRAHRPVRVHGGEVREREVHYHLTPLGSTRASDLQDLERNLAQVLGADHVRVAAEPSGLTLEVSVDPKTGPALLWLLDALGGAQPGEVIAGVGRSGRPVTLSLDEPGSHHIFIWGPAGSGKSELLRTLMIGLALSKRPSELQFIGLDIGGRELAVLEALPHHLIDMASEAEYAQELIDWLGELIELRLANGTTRPQIALLCDELDHLTLDTRTGLGSIMASGEKAGVHVLAAGRQQEAGGALLDGGRNCLQLRGISQASPGRFALRKAGSACEFLAAFVPTRDLDKAVRRIQWVASSGQRFSSGGDGAARSAE